MASESRAGKLLRAAGIYALVLFSVAVATWLNYCVLFRVQTLEKALGLGLHILENALPGTALAALVISIFAVNRIRSAALIGLAAFLVMIVAHWLPLLFLTWEAANRVLWNFSNFLETRSSESFAFVIEVLVLYLLAFGAAFVIIKLIGAAEKSCLRPPPEGRDTF